MSNDLYLLVSGVVLILCYTGIFGESKLSPSVISVFFFTAIIITAISFISLIAARDAVSGDARIYTDLFLSSQHASFYDFIRVQNSEPGFLGMTWILGRFVPTLHMFLVVIFIIQTTILVLALLLVFPSQLAILTAICFMWYNLYLAYCWVALAQGLAITLVLLAFALLIGRGCQIRSHTQPASPNTIKHRILGKREITAALVFLLAFTIHGSALLALPAIAWLYLSKRQVSLRLIAFVMLLTTGGALIVTVNPALLGIFGWHIEQQIQNYSEIETLERYGQTGVNSALIAFLLLPLIFLCHPLRLLKNHKHLRLVIAYLLLTVIYLPFSAIAFNDRIAAYAFTFLPVCLFHRCEIERHSSRRHKSALITLFVITSISLLQRVQ